MKVIEWNKIDAILWDWNGTLPDDVEVNRRDYKYNAFQERIKTLGFVCL